MKKNYIKAIMEMLHSGAEIDSVLTGLSKTLLKKGHTRLHSSVLRGVLRLLNSSTSTSEAKVSVVSESDLQKYSQEITTALKELGGKEGHSTKIDKTLIGGFVAQCNNKILDNSYKAKLVSLYRKLAN